METQRPPLIPDRENVVRLRGLAVCFASREVLHGVDADVPARASTVLVGRSGSGKTTLLRALNRLNECFERSQTRGRVDIRLSGEWVDAYGDGLPVAELRRRVGMVFQTPNLLPLSVERNLTMPLRQVLGLSRSAAREAALEALAEARLWEEVKDRLDAPALELSGGQQQRLCLARALALRPEILLLDEPTASLDFLAARGIEELLIRLKERYTLVVVSHSLPAAARLADQLLVLRDGAVSARLDRADLDRDGTLAGLMEEVF
jgi:phosphate transport system ATP-binding protein